MSENTISTSKVLPVSGITVRSMVIILVQIILSAVCNLMLQSTTIWYVYKGFLPLPMVVSILVIWLISKANKSGKMNFSRQEIAVIALGSNVIASHYYIISGETVANADMFGTMLVNSGIWAYSTQRISMLGFLPAGALPPTEAIDAFLHQGPLNLGAWLGAPLFWSALLVGLYVLTAHFYGLMIQKPLIDIESLPYTPVQGHVYIIKSATENAEGKTTPKLFDLGILSTKIFWIGIVVGILLIVPELISFFVLRVPPVSYVGTWTWDFRPYLSSIFPGALLVYRSYYSWCLLLFLAPLHISFTLWFGAFLFSFVYQWLGVSSGILPFNPASMAGPNTFGRDIGPFKYLTFLKAGFGLGVALWFVYRHRVYFRDSFMAFLGKKQLEEEVGGMTHRQVWSGFIITNVLSILVLSYLGMPAELMLTMLFFWFLYSIFLGEAMSYINENTPYASNVMPFLWDIGWATGTFTTTPSPTRGTMWTTWGTQLYMQSFRTLGYCPERTVFSYKLARETGTRYWDVFIVSMIAALTSIPLIYVNTIWQQSIYPTPYDTNGFYTAAYYETTPYNIGQGDHWLLTILGVIACFAIYLIRARFIWFPIHPVAFAMIGWFSTMLWFFPGLIAFVAKSLVMRFGGTRIYDTYAFPLVQGVLFGYGIALLLLFLSVFFGVSIPAFMAH